VLKNIAFLNFSSQYWRDLTVVIMAPSFSSLPADIVGAYRNRNVRVTGRVAEFDGRPQIVMQTPAQITVQSKPKCHSSGLAARGETTGPAPLTEPRFGSFI
jgi:hypothetical protein